MREETCISQEDWQRYLSREETVTRLKEQGFLDNLLGDPTADIGTAFELAERYNIKLQRGLAYNNVKAYLPQEAWKTTPEVNQAEGFGMFFINIMNQPGWVDRFTVQAAVCHCLLNCREQGLL